MEHSVRSLGVQGRAVMVGIATQPLRIDTYSELLGKEAEVIGCSDHLLWELPLLIEFARQGRLDLSQVVTRSIPLEAGAINVAMNALQQFGGGVRTVIIP
jgi:Zn-dependent alcohol dehydrogenase